MTLLMNNSYYPRFKNNKKKFLVYYPCKKNANSSAKLFFIRHIGFEEKVYFIEDDVPRYKKNLYFQKKIQFKEKINLIKIFPNTQKFQKVETDLKCCITRDPFKRFISAYKNRILFHKDEKFNNLSVDEIIEKLECGLFENSHFLPQSFFLGNNLDYFNIVADVENINLFEKKINNFFGNDIKFPQIQKGGNEFNLKLNITQIKKVNKIYEKDIELLKLL